MNARRIDPRRPARVTADGLRRIVLGSDEGERLGRMTPVASAIEKPRRSAGPFSGCLVVVAHADKGALDDHAREALAAAALLARPDEAVVAFVIGPCQDDLAAAGVDRGEVIDAGSAHRPQSLAQWLQPRLQVLAPRHLLMPDRGADADLGRRLALLLDGSAATHVVALQSERVRVRAAARQDATAPLPKLLLLERQVASTALPFVGAGERNAVRAALDDAPGIEDLGVVAGDAQSVALEEAEFILAAGNGVTDLELFEQLARTLGAATGASRVAVDDGRFPRHKQIGASGRTVQARGYLALGISGAVQHLQGIKDCRHVMAVNLDPSAPIAQRAEMTVVADAQALMRALLDLARAPGVRA
jgi:electron transfer flavoprotein alpha subunit